MLFCATFIPQCRIRHLENRLERLGCRMNVMFYHISFWYAVFLEIA